jgi:hypothetical protein
MPHRPVIPSAARDRLFDSGVNFFELTHHPIFKESSETIQSDAAESAEVSERIVSRLRVYADAAPVESDFAIANADS